MCTSRGRKCEVADFPPGRSVHETVYLNTIFLYMQRVHIVYIHNGRSENSRKWRSEGWAGRRSSWKAEAAGRLIRRPWLEGAGKAGRPWAAPDLPALYPESQGTHAVLPGLLPPTLAWLLMTVDFTEGLHCHLAEHAEDFFLRSWGFRYNWQCSFNLLEGLFFFERVLTLKRPGLRSVSSQASPEAFPELFFF